MVWGETNAVVGCWVVGVVILHPQDGLWDAGLGGDGEGQDAPVNALGWTPMVFRAGVRASAVGGRPRNSWGCG